MITTGMEDGPGPVGYSLRDRLQACRRQGLAGLPVSELLRHVLDVADELDARTRPHGDVKPDAIRVIGGRAHLTDDPAPGLPTGAPGADRATPSYLAPEVWRGTRTASSDQYALACTYAELRTGRPPFHGSSVPELMRAHLESPPDLAPSADAERQVLLRALAKDPGKRFPSCRHLAEDLRRAAASRQP